MVAIPFSGLSLTRAPANLEDDSTPAIPKQAFRVRIEKQVFEELHKATNIKLNLGKSKTLLVGRHSFPLAPSTESKRCEFYKLVGGTTLQCSGLITHTATVSNKSGLADEATSLLAQQMNSLAEQKQNTRTIKLPADKVKSSGKDRWAKFELRDGGSSRNTPSSSFTNTSITKKPTSTKKELTDGDIALRKVLMHLLALGPENEKVLAGKVRAPVEKCLDILIRIGNRAGGGHKWEMVEDLYKELDFYAFPYADDKARKLAISNAKAAFHRIRLKDDAKEWEMLYPPEERGKVRASNIGSNSSKSPLSTIGSTDGSMSLSVEHSPLPPKDYGSEAMTRSISQPGPVVKKKDKIDKLISTMKSGKPKPPPKTTEKKGRPPKDPSAPTTTKRPTKWKEAPVASSKIKSAEFISDSDAEIDLDPPQPAAALKRPAKLPTTSSAKADSDIEMKNAPSRGSMTAQRTPNGVASRVAGKGPAKASVQPVASKVTKPTSGAGMKRKTTPSAAPAPSRLSPTANSPSKPSPLGTSHPVTASDMDSSPSSSSSSPMIFNSTARPGSVAYDAQSRYIQPIAGRKRKTAMDEDGSSSSHSSKRSRIEVDEDILRLAKKFKALYAKYYQELQEVSVMRDSSVKDKRAAEVTRMAHQLTEWKDTITRKTAEQQRLYDEMAEDS
ncbi:hypothetical protein BJ508DRAFT_304591 [Ascobolus immersus RN42]|uniref:Uncharacterized protein n=1 Tax=Ascobolus immersus RN42 TaxID=1160509 RepID=A0A3N4IE25_ASCIM|nr:hypothetical protein BJ508DRAFT_304591 [Ascobolus immersus RN42]